jgi:hypothetical protein
LEKASKPPAEAPIPTMGKEAEGMDCNARDTGLRDFILTAERFIWDLLARIGDRKP